MDATGTPTTVVVAQQQHESYVKAYLRVFLALLVLTMVEYLYAKLFADSPAFLLIAGLVVIAVVKAALVGMFFMHLLFEGRWKYLMLIPTTFLAVVTVAGLIPDIAMQRPDPDRAVPEVVENAPERP